MTNDISWRTNGEPPLGANDRLRDYELLQQIEQGGMGSVYYA